MALQYLLPVKVLTLLFLAILPSVLAMDPSKQVHIIYMGAKSKDVFAQELKATHMGHLASVLGSEKAAKSAHLYSYINGFNGFSALLHPESANALRDLPGVISVFPSKIRKIATTHSFEFVGLSNSNPEGLWSKTEYGSGAIIGLLDTGIWPESASFSDTGMRPPPSKWQGKCVTGDSWNTTTCNNKVIGAKYFLAAFESHDVIQGYRSARDDEGHGTHTSSTAAGRFVAGVNIDNLATGTAMGGAPLAHVAMYKVCWNGGSCDDADMLAGLDEAIADGVDVISVSIGNENPQPQFFEDPVAIGLFHAVEHGIFASASAGNSGFPGTATNLAPWIATVAAGTVDRTFVNFITAGNISATGVSLTSRAFVELWPIRGPNSPLVYAGDIPSNTSTPEQSKYCEERFLDQSKLNGTQVLVCEVDPELGFPYISESLGAAGFIVISSTPVNPEDTDRYAKPVTQVTAAVGAMLRKYINSTRSPSVLFSKVTTQVNGSLTRPAPLVGSFSSQGPNTITPDILKPDIMAPGVNILASWSPGSLSEPFTYNMISGTSMSCPHISGLAALMKSLHPDWSPAAIKSALMTSASPYDNMNEIIKDASLSPATPFQYGSGQVNAMKVVYPGLVYDLCSEDYLTFLCSTGYNSTSIQAVSGSNFTCSSENNAAAATDLNYPSIAASAVNSILTVTRTVTNVGPAHKSTYHSVLQAPPGVAVSVVPPVLELNSIGEMLKYEVTFIVREDSRGEYVFGRLTWTNGHHDVSSPIALIASIEPMEG